MSNKVYVLKYYYNQYDQLDGYVETIFKEKPDTNKLREYYNSNSCLGGLHSKGKTLRECIDILASGETVYEFGTNGGDYWQIEDMELL